MASFLGSLTTRSQENRALAHIEEQKRRLDDLQTAHGRLNFIEALTEAAVVTHQQAHDQGLDPNQIHIDQSAFLDLIHHSAMVKSQYDEAKEPSAYEDEIGAEYAAGAADERALVDPAQADHIYDKMSGENFTVTQHFIIQATLNELESGKIKSIITQQCPALEKSRHKPVINSSKVTMVQNTTCFPLNFKLNGIVPTNIQMDENEDTYKNVSYKLPPNAVQPLRVNSVISEGTQGSRFNRVEDLHVEFAYVTDAEIDASVKTPTLEDVLGGDPFLKDPKTYEKTKKQYESIKEKFDSLGLCFIGKGSPLGRFIHMTTNANIGSQLALDATFPGHIVLSTQETKNQMIAMKTMLSNSPIGKLHGMSGEFFRADGKPWNFIPSGIPEEERISLQTTRQTIQITVDHKVTVVG